MAKPILAVGCTGVPNEPFLQKFDSAGNPYPHGHRLQLGYNVFGLWGIALDAAGDTYSAAHLRYYADAQSLAAYNEPARTVYKHNPLGDLRWAVNHGAAVSSLALDPSGNLYTYGDAVNASGQVRQTPEQTTGFVTTRKYGPDGTLLWSTDHGYAQAYDGFESFARPLVYRDNYVYSGSIAFPYSAPLLAKTDAATGTVAWRAETSFNGAVLGLAVDASGNVFACGIFYDTAPPSAVRKYSADGTVMASVPAPVNDAGTRCPGRRIVLRPDGRVVVAMSPVQNGDNHYTLYEYDANLIYVGRDSALFYNWSVNSLALGPDDELYLTRTLPGGSTLGNPYTVARVDGAALTWQANTLSTGPVLTAVSALCVAASEVATPPLRFPLALGVPTITGDRYAGAPGLPFGLALGIPTLWREYIGPPLPIVHRLAFPGAPDLALRPRSLQLRADATRTSVTLVVGLPDAVGLAALEAQIGQAMDVLRGVRFRDGAEQIDPLATVTLESVAQDIGPESASLTLIGSAATQTGGRTRTLKSVSYRNDRDGVRRVRCAVDPQLRPGDTVDLGDGETLVVGELTLYATPTAATMEITE